MIVQRIMQGKSALPRELLVGYKSLLVSTKWKVIMHRSTIMATVVKFVGPHFLVFLCGE